MRGPNFLDKSLVDFLVTNNSAGVYGFINYSEKKVWISYTENISEAIVRNIKLIETRQHKIKKLEGWDICAFGKTDDKQTAKNHFRLVCKNYKDKGLEILNKEFNYRIWGSIGPHFKKPEEYLYYIWIGTKNKKMAVLGIFSLASEGEQFLKGFKEGSISEFSAESKRLVIEYKLLDKNEYKRLLNETLY